MSDPPSFDFGDRRIGGDAPVFIVAELSGNHRGDLGVAREIVRAAHHAGADAIKLQTYTADTITLDVHDETFTVPDGSQWSGRTLHDLYTEAHTPWAWHEELAGLATSLGMRWFSTPFDASAVDFLESLGAEVYKIASFELVDLPLLKRVARTGKPMIVSTGMATLAEIEEAVTTIRETSASPIALLRTNSGYPADPGEMDLRTMVHLRDTFDVVVGLSDHTLDFVVPVTATALGAKVIEKHLTLRRADGGPDASFSLEPEEFTATVRAVRRAEATLGEVRYGPSAREAPNLRFRRSLYVARDIAEGETLTADNIRSVRPSGGLHTRHEPEVHGRRATRALAKGAPLDWDMFE